MGNIIQHALEAINWNYSLKGKTNNADVTEE